MNTNPDSYTTIQNVVKCPPRRVKITTPAKGNKSKTRSSPSTVRCDGEVSSNIWPYCVLLRTKVQACLNAKEYYFAFCSLK